MREVDANSDLAQALVLLENLKLEGNEK